MAINGIATVVYGVDDVARCADFYEEFGLALESRSDTEASFRLPEGSLVRLLHIDDPRLPERYEAAPGVRETIWGVESAAELATLENDLSTDRPVRRDAEGIVHFRDDQGLPMGLRVFERHLPALPAERVNVSGQVERWNEHRTWYDRATPALMHHVVYGVPDFDRGMAFYVKRLGFRVTDISRDRGIFARCNGRNDHHNLFFMKTDAPMFHHVSYGVQNIDEVVAGANHMSRKGWKSALGLGRHRISSTLFYYIIAPCGGEAEYSADMDYLDDAWQPRMWDPKYGNLHWVAALPPHLQVLPAPDVRILAEIEA